MDDLELLKQDWQKIKPNEFKAYSENDLFLMTKKESVSVAKWIFILGFLELLFWTGLDYIIPSSPKGKEILAIHPIIDMIANLIAWSLKLLPFIFLGLLLYLNYKIINTECPKILMRKILLMRNLVKWYIRIFLISIPIAFILSSVTGITKALQDSKVDYGSIIILLLISFWMSFVGVLFIRFIYHIIYGNLIYKLEQNYKELSKVED